MIKAKLWVSGFCGLILMVSLCPQAVSETSSGDRHAFFGDLHVHTRFSSDAYVFNVRATPDDAYRYAKGEAIDHVSGKKIQAQAPYDFLAVTDHAEYLGIVETMGDKTHPLSRHPLAEKLLDNKDIQSAFDMISASIVSGNAIEELNDDKVIIETWEQVINAAERHNQPGKFSTFVGFEWSGAPNGNAIHRNVIFGGGRGEVESRPFSALDSHRPEDLWSYMERSRQKGREVLSIPHNSNMSNGKMFSALDSWGKPIDRRWAKRRNTNEPLVEISQVKGTSETHPQLSPNDEWSSFSIYEHLLGNIPGESKVRRRGSYVRDAYKTGLQHEQRLLINPFQFGVIGSSDSHNGNVAVEENAFTGKVGILDATAEKRRIGGFAKIWSASGLTGIWAEENTRGSLFTALKRRETFATSGTRIRLRLFAGWSFPKSLAKSYNGGSEAYRFGVPMGSELRGQGESVPEMLVWAAEDPRAAPLDRLQIVKGWVEDGKVYERVFDVACGQGSPSPENHRCSDPPENVNLNTCNIQKNSGNSTLSVVWRDPYFSSHQRAFYYVRALEVPSCHWSTWDAVNSDLPLVDGAPSTIQERAWSSPIWYRP
jgi:hypothetical protein